MKLAIWKFPLTASSLQDVMMPPKAIILSAHSKHNVVCIWAIVNTEAARDVWDIRTIEQIETGEQLDDRNRNFIGTVIKDGSGYVSHVFERLNHPRPV
jgi:hypothetical protein